MNTEELKHVLRHDLKVEVKAALSFIELIIQDIENNSSEEEIKKNLKILKQTFKDLSEHIRIQ